MPYQTAPFDQYVDAHRERFLAEFARFIAQPSVAADRRGFTDIEILDLGGEEFAASAPGGLPERAAIAASEQTWGKTPVMYPWYAGSGPVYPLSAKLGIPVVFAGATWHPNARAHSPNENILVKDYFDSMRFTAAFLAHFAALEP